MIGAFAGDELVGVAGLRLEARSKLKHKATIWGVYVRDAWQGAGLGEKLIRAVVDEAPAHLETVSLIVSDGNPAAQRLYARLGFAPTAFEPRALKLADGSYVDEIAMERRLR